jgi:hypothetical protein
MYHAQPAGPTEPGDVVAPPTFVMAAVQFDPDFHFRPKPGEPWLGSGWTPTGTPAFWEGRARRLHAEQHFTYHRPIRPGDVLSWEERQGQIWEKQGRRGGTLRFAETIIEYRDQLGELVVTARNVQVAIQRAPGEGKS